MTSGFEHSARGLVAPRTKPDIPDGGPQSIAALLDEMRGGAPGREALVDRHRRYTYAELDRAVNRAAHALLRVGAGPHERVAMCAPNCTELVVAFLACQRIGAVWVGLNRVLAPPEKAFILRDAGARVLIADGETAGQIDPVRSELPELERIVRVEPGDIACEWSSLVEDATVGERPPISVDPFAPAAIAYTSGTTGYPKGAVHGQHNLALVPAVHHALGGRPDGARIASVLPLTILNLMILGPLVAFRSGGCAICIDRASAVELAEWIARERVQHFSGVPTVVYDLLAKPEIRPDDLRTLRRPLIGGAEVPEALCSLYRERFGSEIIVGYGMTEAPTAVTMTDGARPWRPGVCGRVLPHVELRILGEDGKPVARGEAGEICVAPATDGPWAGAYTPMLGYWNRPEDTAAALRGGVFHSGDLGVLDDDGWLYFRGRLSELIIRGGANVYPAEVERVLASDARVAGCAVLGERDERLGERVIAFVELARGATATEDELRARCATELAGYKVPEQIHFVAALPRNAMGKVIKRDIAVA